MIKGLFKKFYRTKNREKSRPVSNGTKVLSYVLISFILFTNLFAPVSVVFEKDNGINIGKNTASAEEVWDGSITGFKNAFPKSLLMVTSSDTLSSDLSIAGVTLVVDTGIEEGLSSEKRWRHVASEKSPVEAAIIEGLTFYVWGRDTTLGEFKNKDAFVLKVVEKDTNKTGFIDVTQTLIKDYINRRIVTPGQERMKNAITRPITINTSGVEGIIPSKEGGLSVLKGGTTYDLTLYYLGFANMKFGETIPGLEKHGPNYFPIAKKSFTTPTKEEQSFITGIIDSASTVSGGSASTLPACSLVGAIDMLGIKGTFMGCVAQTFYYVLFVPTSYLFALSGVLFDSTLAYSVQDSSYSIGFVTEGWKLIRDFCNLFFIFIMLYIAIGTILNLNSVKTKETIINVVIIGLFINFSLFVTQVIIDASNITARVFYNSDSIKLTSGGVDGASTAFTRTKGEGGVISLSSGLVNKINPQNIIINSSKVNDIQSQVSNANVIDREEGNLGAGQFILITIMASGINIVGFTIFLTVGMLFIARVIGLWLAMILSPLAFFTYILPEMAQTKKIGWKNWWPETLQMAFLAPVFIFFMFLILKFLEMGSFVKATSLRESGLNYFIATIIPFLFIMIFMMKAKKIAVDMSGEFGEMAVKAGSAVSGLALGAVTGGTAMLGRATFGRLGNSIANSDRLQSAERKGGISGFGAKMLRNIGTGAGNASFDARSTKVGANAGKYLGVDMGKAKEGGFVKARADNVAARVKRAKELELSEDSAQTQAVRRAESALYSVKTDPDRQNTTLDLNNGINDPVQVKAAVDAATGAFQIAESALVNAQNTLDSAENALALDPRNTALIRARNYALSDRDTAKDNKNQAEDALTSAKVGNLGLGGLDRAIATTETNVANAERALKDATDTLKTIDPKDVRRRQKQETLVKRLRTNRDAQIMGTDTVDLTTGVVNGRVNLGRDQAKKNKLAREATIRAHERPVNEAQDILTRAQNEVVRANNQIRKDYAGSIEGAWSNTINSILTLGEHSALGEREAAYKILAGAQEEKKTAERH